jgi:maleylpyruvate isomerase
LELKGLAYEQVPVNLRQDQQQSEAYLRANPEGLVPMLEDGDLKITQSVAILEYLEEVFPNTPLMPSKPADRARVRSLVQMIASDIHPLNNLRVLKYLIGPAGASRAAKDAWYQHWIAVGLTAFEKRLSEAASGLYCHGDSPSLADCVLIPQVYNAELMACDLSAMPRVREIYARCTALPTFARAHPNQCPDFPGP